MLKKFKSNLCLMITGSVLAFNVSASDHTETNSELIKSEYNTNAIVLASFIFPNGNKINFGQLPQSNEMYVEEGVEIGEGEIFILDHLEGGILDKYLAVTPSGTPVPHELIEFEQEEDVYDVISDEGQINEGAFFLRGPTDEVFLNEQSILDKKMTALAGRKVVDSLVEGVFVDWSHVGEDIENMVRKVVTDTKAAGQGSCNNSTGYLYFQEHHCNISGSHGSGSSQSHCDYPMYSNIQRTSTSRMRSTYSRVANCGGGDVAVVHSKKTGGFWYEQDTWFVPVNQARATQTWAGKYSIRKDRRVNVLPVTPGGYVRAWTKFTRNSK